MNDTLCSVEYVFVFFDVLQDNAKLIAAKARNNIVLAQEWA